MMRGIYATNVRPHAMLWGNMKALLTAVSENDAFRGMVHAVTRRRVPADATSRTTQNVISRTDQA